MCLQLQQEKETAEIRWKVGALEKVHIVGGKKSAKRNIRDLCSCCCRETTPEMHRPGVLRVVKCKLEKQLHAPLYGGDI